MSDTSGPTSYAPFARWDRDSQSWRTSEATSLWDLELSSLTLPAWGGLRDGELCEHPTPERLTSGLDYLSLPTPTVDDASNITRASGCYNSLTRTATMLPTPRATDGPKGGPGQVNGRGVPDSLPAISALLPTPAVNDMGEGKTLEWWDDWAPRQKAADGRPAPHGRSLAIKAQRLLPTPSAADGMGGHASRSGDRSDELLLPGLVKTFLPTPISRDWKGQNQANSMNCLPVVAKAIGETTAPPLSDGSASSDDPHQHQLSLDGLALPA